MEAVAPGAVTPADIRDPAVLVEGLERREVSGAERDAIVHGRAIEAHPTPDSRHPVAVFAGRELVAVAEREGGRLKPRVVVAAP